MQLTSGATRLGKEATKKCVAKANADWNNIGLLVAVTNTQSRLLPINGTQLFYRDRGQGDETIVFSHGLLFDSRQYEDQIDSLKASYRCIAYDHRGQGQSTSSRSPVIDLETLYFDAVALIERLEIAPCHFVGLSMGGFVGLRLAARRPDTVSTLTLLGTRAQQEPAANLAKYRRLNRIARTLGTRPIAGRLMPIFFGDSFLSDPARSQARQAWRKRIAACQRDVYKAVNGVLYRPSIEAELQNIQTPTLILHGEQDRAIPPQAGRQLAAAISKAEFYLVPNAGHSSPIEQPNGVTERMGQFLQQQ